MTSLPKTTSTLVTETVNGSHDFRIVGYSLLKGMGIGKSIGSTMFMVGAYKWCIVFYPDGKNVEDNSRYVSAFIGLSSDSKDVRALFELTLVDQNGNCSHKVNANFGKVLDSGPSLLNYRATTWGYDRFFERTLLESSEYLKDDTLMIRCRVGVVNTRTEYPNIYSINVPPSNMGQEYGKLLESGQETDVKFEVDGEIISAHKLVLATRSPVFKAQLFGQMNDRNTEHIKVEDMKAPVFKALLQFIYWDSPPNMNSNDSSTLMAQHLFVAADRYGIERLKLLCEDSLCKNVEINTVGTTLALAEQHHCLQLKSVCLKFIAMVGNLKAVMQTEGFIYLKERYPSILAEILEHVP